MIHIICIQWGNKYPDEYVNKLYKSIYRNTSRPFIFTCYSDRYTRTNKLLEDIDIQPIPQFTGDWFSKISLYNQDLYHPNDQIFFFDLDTVIIGNLDPILDYGGDFIVLRDFYRKDGFGSGLMSFAPGAVDLLWQKFTPGQKCKNGDQGWIELHYKNPGIWQNEFPGKIASYKVHYRDRDNRQGEKMDTSDVRIICFHGRPAVHEVDDKIIKDNWK